MMRSTITTRPLLLVLDAFLAITTIAGGIGLITGAIPLPLDWLAGSLFSSYMVPGLTLLVVVGGVALAATVLLLLRHALAVPFAVLSGVLMMGFEIVEVMVVGSEPGLMRNLQLFFFALGLVIALLALWTWATERGLRGQMTRGGVQSP